MQRDAAFKDEKRFELSSLLGSIDSLSQSQNDQISRSTFVTQIHDNRKAKIELDFFECLKKDSKLRVLCRMVQARGFPAGITTRKFYNDLCGAKSTVKRDVLNKCLNLFAERTFYTSRTEHSKKINNGIERHFQPNYCALILRTLFSVFKVSCCLLWFFCATQL